MGEGEDLMRFFGDVAAWFGDPSHWTGGGGVPTRLLEHAWYAALSLAIASMIAIPLGLFVGHTRRGEFIVASLANLWRAMPSFAILGIAFIGLLGLGLAFSVWPTVIAMVFLGIPPILTNTYVGIQAVDPDLVEAARGMGMEGGQVLRRVEVPLAAPLLVTGLRTAAVQVVATATLAAWAAAGGLGQIIREGFALRDFPQIFAGASIVATFALVVDGLFALWERRVRPGRLRPALEHLAQVPMPPAGT